MDIHRLKDVTLSEYLNQTICLAARLEKIDVRVAKNNSTYADIGLKDRDRSVNMKWFDFNTNHLDVLKPGGIYAFLVKVKPYKDAASVLVDTDQDPTQLYCEMPNENKDDYIEKEELYNWAHDKIEYYISQLTGYPLFNIVSTVLNENYDKYVTQSAANTFHHTGLGGLMVHSASVCELAVKICDMYNELYGADFVNKKLLIAGCLLHDIGKVQEMDYDVATGQNEYTTMSILESHSLSGIKMVAMCAAKLGITGTEVDELIHLIASHHGRTDWGALMNPNCIEAKILSIADDMDATANRFKKVYKDMECGTHVVTRSGGQMLCYYKPLVSGREPKL